MRSLVAVIVAALLGGCLNQFESAPSEAALFDLEYNITLERLHSLLGDFDYYDVVNEVVVCGCVTATDESGNFYKTFVIEQSEYAIEILEGLTYSYVRHGEGYLVLVDLEGLRLTRSRGVLQAGLPASDGSYYDVDYMSHEVVADKHITNTGIIEPTTPRPTTLEELESDAVLERLAGALVTIEGLSLVVDEESTSSEATLWEGTIEFVDEEERSLWCYTSYYSNFSKCEVPEGSVSLTGILQYDGSSRMIKLRSEADCREMEI